MKGKQFLPFLHHPAAIFILGVLTTLVFIAVLVYLHVTSIRQADRALAGIHCVETLAFAAAFGEADFAENIDELLLVYKDLQRTPYLSRLLYSLNLNLEMKEIESRADLNGLYNQMGLMRQILDKQRIDKNKTFRKLYFMILVTVSTMIVYLGVGQYESHRINKTQIQISRTKSHLYDQLEKERSLIAFELHDDIAQKLALIKRYFTNKNSIDDHTVLMENYAVDVIRRVRYLSRMLKVPDDPRISFKENLETLFSDFSVLSDFKLNRKTVGLNALNLKPNAALHIYRVIQEILTNSRIHSQATEIDLYIVYSHPSLNIRYSDNGKGFDPYLVYRKGIGLDSIKYRLELLSGRYQLNSKEGEGTDITIDIPVELCEIS